MKALDLPSLVVLGAALYGALGVLLIFVIPPSLRRTTLPPALLGNLAIALAAAAEYVIPLGRLGGGASGYASPVLAVLGYALFLYATHATIGIGMPTFWYFAVAGVHLALAAAFAGFEGPSANRTVVLFSSACILLFAPTVALDVRFHGAVPHLEAFDLGLGIAVAMSIGRLALALGGAFDATAVRHGLDAWLFAGFSVGGIGAGVVFILVAATLRRRGGSARADEGRPRLSLGGLGLAEAERQYVLALVSGIPVGGIAEMAGVSRSTVRNTLARAYRKLGVSDRVGLSALAGRQELVP